MTTFCILCRAEISQVRQRRAARTCSPECQKEYRRLYLADRHSRFCKLCGRGLRKASPSTGEAEGAKGTLLLARETALYERGRPV